ncbi:hypothetical protein MC7420_8300 [Coleofasciculus chthonoplastes PCC 7420]|uniref:Uncharacterized protein n=1 Tax=Coleofasciculus chthonoplastes PCC 7420 TaxID=118168 RepID=B4W0Z7_9CYAN|nr:PEP-CTERM sorting domain-containing protein [Coleofasciculus chthonoplastes]EDX72208.1 hypothetical protein MC7420_8300 [Coleofasciculus chthonoplastes PCC 7420]
MYTLRIGEKLSIAFGITFLSTAMSGVVSNAPAQAFSIDSINLLTDNARWSSIPSGFASGSTYDGFNFTVSGTPGEQVSEISFSFSFKGLFDDSVALDLNGDGTIDFAVDYHDVAATLDPKPVASIRSLYTPWSDANDVENTITNLTITPTGSTGSVSIYGKEVILGLTDQKGGYRRPSESFSNLADITLEDLGLEPGGLIPESGTVTTSEIRIGYLNIGGQGGGNPEIESENFTISDPEPVPEPLTILGSATALGIGGLLKREHSKKQKKS